MPGGRNLFADETTGRNLFAETPPTAAPPATAISRAGPLERGAIGLGEAALSLGTGMVSSPLNHFWNAIMEGTNNPPGEPVGTYSPKTPEGQGILSALSSGMQMTGLPQAVDKGLDLNNPDPAVRATGHLIGGAIGVLPLMRVAKGGVLTPTRSAIKAAASDAYDAAKGGTAFLPQNNLATFTSGAEKMLADGGVDTALHPKTMAALNRLTEDATKPGIVGHSIQGTETLRKVLSNAENEAVASSAPGQISSDARLAGKLLDEFDSFVEQQLPESSSQYGSARALWNVQRKAQDVEQIVERAKNQAGQYSVSGMDNALRSQFKTLADNPRRFGRFNADERAAILQVVRGGPLQDAARLVGKLAIRGPIQGMAALAGEGAMPGAGLAMAGVGEGSRFLSSLLRGRAAANVSDTVRRGAIPHMQIAPLPGSKALPQLGYLPATALAQGQSYQDWLRQQAGQ